MSPGPQSGWGPARNSSRYEAFRAGWSASGDIRAGKAADKGDWRDRMCDERVDAKWDKFSWITVRALFESVNDVLAKAKPQFVHERRARWVAGQRTTGAGASSSGDAGPTDLAAIGQALVGSVGDLLSGSLPGRGEDAQAPAMPEFVVDQRSPTPTGFLIIGDTGEQDASQFATTPGLVSRQVWSDPDGNPVDPLFMFILSDVIYPAGDINEYVNGFYIPYQQFEKPIYAIPGNHDWYDGLNGFMYHFCGAEPLRVEKFRYTAIDLGTRIARLLWRGAEPPNRPLLARLRDSRPWGRDAAKAVQPAPYFAIDTGDLLLVGIDTGVSGEIDDEQGRWLLEVSKIAKQKVLLTGKPIYTDGKYHPGPIRWTRGAAGPTADQTNFATVDDVVRCERFGYIAAIGGDVHNYQRYPVRLVDQDRTIPYLVSGGGGAYLSPTDRIPPIGLRPQPGEHPWPRGLEMPQDEGFDPTPPERKQAAQLGTDSEPPPGDQHRFHCYPLRGDSLAYNARTAAPRFFNAVVLAAAAIIAAAYLFHYGVPLTVDGRFGVMTLFAAVVVGGVMYLGYGKLRPNDKDKALFAEPRDEDDAAERQRREAAAARSSRAYKPFGIAIAALALIGLVAWGVDVAVDWADGPDEDLLGSGRFWSAVGVSLAVPVLLIAAILVSYDSRGSVPRVLRTLVVVGGMTAGIALLADLPGAGSAPSWFLNLLGVFAVGAAGVLGLGSFRRRQDEREEWTSKAFLLDRALVIVAPALLFASLIREFDTTWIAEMVAAVAFAALIPFLFGLRPSERRTQPICPTSRWRERIEAIAAVASATLWVGALITLLDQVADGWIARDLVAAFAVLILTAVAGLFAFLGVAMARKRVVWGLVPAILLVFFGGWAPWFFAACALALLIAGVGSVRHFAVGRLNADRAVVFIRDRLGLKPSGGDRGTKGPQGSERAVADLLYPYHWKEERKEGKPGKTGLPEMLAHLIAEMSDADQPPFFKHFLRVDVRSLDPEDAGGPDRELVIRCFGVTGYLEEEGDLPLEDQMSVPFYSPANYASITA